MSEETCSFCLGNDTDIPSFGTLHDAQDLVHPCKICSLVIHRKCLLDWFNSIPEEDLMLIHGRTYQTDNSNLVHELGVGAPPPPSANTGTGNEASFQFTINAVLPRWLGLSYDNDEIEFTTSAQAELTTGDLPGGFPSETEQLENGEATIPIENIPRYRSVTPLNFSSYSAISPSNMMFIVVPCPQCKQQIVFAMRRSKFITFQNTAKVYITRLVNYGGVFLIITSAVTGVLSLGYVGLTTCGLKIMDWMVPGSVLVQMLTRNTKKNQLSNDLNNSLKKILFGTQASKSYIIDNLEAALVNGLIDPLKFARVSTLPIVLYQMRSCSILDCIFGKHKWDSIYHEIMFFGYFASLGECELIKGIFGNLIKNLKHPTKPRSLLSGINLFKINNLVSLIVPIRWTYDLIYRLTLNRMYFDLAMKAQPRQIANHLPEQETEVLESINLEINKLKGYYLKQPVPSFINSSPLITQIYQKFQLLKSKNYIHLQILSNYYKTIACLRYDYSKPLSYTSITMKSITTILWPYIASKVGRLLLKFIKKQSDRNIVIANIVSMIIVAVGKEVINLWIGRIKANLRSEIKAVNVDDVE